MKIDAYTDGVELGVDAAAVALVSVAICLAADHLVFMSALVPAVWVLRMAAWARVRPRGPGEVPVELAFFVVCTVLGGFNDYNTVVRHGVYAYSVPVWFPTLTTIPLWMLLFWGLVLRLVATLAAWRDLGEPLAPLPHLRLPGRVISDTRARLALVLGLVFATRQCVYRWFDDPVASWAPFAVALVVYAAVLGVDARERRLGLLALVAGPLVEALYIQVGGLHRYPLGWFGGVPLWIVLWWVLAVWVWRDVSLRIRAVLATTWPVGTRASPARGGR